MNVEVIVISDDLTGAADTGIKFQSVFNPIYLLSHTGLDKLDIESRPRAIAIFTNSRGSSTQDTKSIFRQTTRALQTLKHQWIYKKIDSCMRGAVGLECSILVSSLKKKACFVAPAYPLQDRTTVNDIHLVGGKPVDRTEIGRDPICPVPESSLTKLISANHRYKVGHVGIRFVEGGIEALVSEVTRLVTIGNRLIGFDAKTEDHLKKIAEIALSRFSNVLLAGSAGLASAIVEKLGRNISKDQTPRQYSPSRGYSNLLIVSGSTSNILLKQIMVLQKTFPCEIINLEPEILLDLCTQSLKDKIVDELSCILINRCLVLQIKPSTHTKDRWFAQSLLRGLAELVRCLIERSLPSAVFLSGGDTAAAILDRLNPYPIRLEKEIVDCVVATTALQGPLSGRMIVLKAGALGSLRSLVELYRYCYEGGDHDR